MSRQCSRPGCSEPAAATLTYVYSRRLAWLDGLTLDRDPHDYDLCDRHAGRVKAPYGWRLEDRRFVAVVAGDDTMLGREHRTRVPTAALAG